jgi:hypothetical protein
MRPLAPIRIPPVAPALLTDSMPASLVRSIVVATGWTLPATTVSSPRRLWRSAASTWLRRGPPSALGEHVAKTALLTVRAQLSHERANRAGLSHATAQQTTEEDERHAGQGYHPRPFERALGLSERARRGSPRSTRVRGAITSNHASAHGPVASITTAQISSWVGGPIANASPRHGRRRILPQCGQSSATPLPMDP